MVNNLFYSLYKWLVLVPFDVACTVFMFLLILLICFYDAELASRTVARLWGRILFRLTPATLRVRGGENIAAGQGYVVAANHLSQYDILVLYGWLPLDFKWVMKQELRSVPIIGQAGRLMGHIFLDRRDRTAAIRTLQEVKSQLKPGVSVLFFPEGTRSRDGRLKAFKKGAFVTARDLELPILPVSLIGTDGILPPDGFRLRPGRAELVIHAPIPGDEVMASTPDELLARTRGIIAGSLPREQTVARAAAEVACTRG